MNTSTKLPDKLSELLRLAIGDLIKVRADPRYEVYMTDWHWPSHNGKCRVCLAGSVLAKSFELDPAQKVVWGTDIDKETQNKLMALNELRCGYIEDAYRELEHDKPASLPDEIMVVNTQPRTPSELDHFQTEMLALADLLAAHGE